MLEQNGDPQNPFAKKVLEFCARLDAFELASNKPPDVLYHYCGAPAALAILSSVERVMWASNVRFLNDAMETKHFDVLFERMRDRIDSPLNAGSVHYRFHYGLTDPKGWLNQLNYYVVCLSECRDDLSQWRAYGDDGHGFCLGFNVDKLQTTQGALYSTTDRALRRVVYDEGEQIERIESLYRQGIELLKEGSDLGYDDWTLQFPAYLNHRLDQLQCTFKHTSWSSEQEWRLIKVLGSYAEAEDHQSRYSELKVRCAGKLHVSYLEFPLGLGSLTSITIGPRQNQQLADETIRLLLDRTHYSGSEVDIFFSSIPLR